MNMFSVQLVLVFTLASTHTAAAKCSNSNSSGSSGVQYFGFWGPDQPDAMHTFTNLAFASDVADALANKAHGIASLLKVEGIFVDKDTRWQFKLHADYEARWQASVPAFEPLLRNGSIIGFFLGDELPWNGLPLAQVQAMARAVRASFPVGTAVIYTNAAWPTQLPTMAGQYPHDAGSPALCPPHRVQTA